MRNEKKDRVLLPGETKDCVCHCGICKKRNLSQNFKYDEYRERFKCPSCGRYIEYLYANKEEKAINKPIMERNRKTIIHFFLFLLFIPFDLIQSFSLILRYVHLQK